MTTLIETIALACLLGFATISDDASTSYTADSELCAEPGGTTIHPPPPEN